MKKNLALLTGCIMMQSFLNLNAQTTNIWYFGSNAGIDFNSGNAVILSNGALNTYEGCATICNNSGAILFYTDGSTVYNSIHSIMQNGTGLNGNFSSNQAAVIIPFPGNPDNYYIFTTDATCSGPASYSVVDMTQAAGLGAVTIKNNLLLASVTEKLTAVMDANGIDYWAVVHESNNSSFYSYHITATGVSAPVVSTAGSVISGTDCAGGMKLNPQGTQLAVTLEQSHTFELFDFNNSTGIVSNARVLGPLSSYTYSCEFSGSGHYLYGNVDPGTNPMIYQFDVTLGTAAAINASMIQVGTGNGSFHFGTLQNAPDGKIYVAREGEIYLGAINDPDVQGMACNYVDTALLLSGSNTLGLPNYVASYFNINTGIKDYNKDNDNFLIFPNPFTTKAMFSFINPNKEKFLFTLYDIMGRVIETISTDNNKIVLTKGSKQQGVYLFNLSGEKMGERMNGKIVIGK
ncbi:MAG: T9SS type A sorting domain-containing protein [Bacteroidota bacterium]